MDENPPRGVAFDLPRLPRSRRAPVIVLAAGLAASLVANLVLVLTRDVCKADGRLTADVAEIRDARGRLIARFVYGDADAFPVSSEHFDRSGAFQGIARDADADGWYEQYETPGPDGLTGTSYDRDGDGLVGDHVIIRRAGVVIAEHVDDTGDGWLDTMRVFDSQGRVRLVMIDRDGNGVAEQLRCFDAGGQARDLPPLDCSL